MHCRDVWEIVDSFLSEELPPETTHEILGHLESCSMCRTQIGAGRRLRGALRAAFNRAPELQPSAEFRSRLRDDLRKASVNRARPWSPSGRWLALAAGVVLAVGVAGAVLTTQSDVSAEALARDAIGDHQNCALKYRLVRMPVSLEEAAQRFDRAYRHLLSAPPDDVPTADGPARVTERHSCAYGARRFGHVIMEYRGRVVSLLMTTNEGGTRNVGRDAIPRLIGRPMDGLSVMSVNGAHHAILLVGDLDSTTFTQLSTAVAVPLARRLEVRVIPDRINFASRQFDRAFQSKRHSEGRWPSRPRSTAND